VIPRSLISRTALPGLVGLLWCALAWVVVTGTTWWLLPLCLATLVTACVLAALAPEYQLYAPVRLHGPRDGTAVALTFDDGPDPEHTPAILDALEAAGARGTFFVVGERAQAHPELVRELVERGHQVANHSHRHRWWESLFFLPAAERDLSRASDAIEAAAGVRPALFRPPIGMLTPELWVASRRHGMDVAGWTVRPYDGRVRDPAEITRRVTSAQGPGDVVLLHDTAGRDGSPPPARDALPAILSDLTERGLQAVTLSDLWGVPAYRDGSVPPREPVTRLTYAVNATFLALWVAAVALR